jgi:hypothetical protein
MVNVFDGPIPGANYTSDTRNYPWHRPPEYTTIDEAIDYISDTLTDEKTAFAILDMMEIGLDIVTITNLLIMKGVSKGKWALDLGLLLAGPVSHILVIMAKGYGVKYEMGLEDNRVSPGKAYFKEISKKNRPTKEEVADVKAEVQSNKTGFMAMANAQSPVEEGIE